MWNFPHCIGAIDGKHIMMQAPNNSGSSYFNYKGWHSIVLMAVCDASYCFTHGSDGGVLSNSMLGQAMESGNLGVPDPDCIHRQTIPTPYFFVPGHG